MVLLKSVFTRKLKTKGTGRIISFRTVQHNWSIWLKLILINNCRWFDNNLISFDFNIIIRNWNLTNDNNTQLQPCYPVPSLMSHPQIVVFGWVLLCKCPLCKCLLCKWPEPVIQWIYRPAHTATCKLSCRDYIHGDVHGSLVNDRLFNVSLQLTVTIPTSTRLPEKIAEAINEQNFYLVKDLPLSQLITVEFIEAFVGRGKN